MKAITAVLNYSRKPFFPEMVRDLSRSPLVEKVIAISGEGSVLNAPAECSVVAGSITAGATLGSILDTVSTTFLLVILTPWPLSFEPHGLERLLKAARDTNAGSVYADFFEATESEKTIHPVTDYQIGSVRDSFDFGPVLLFSVSAIRKALGAKGLDRETQFAGLYDLRLQAAVDGIFIHVKEPLSSVTPLTAHSASRQHLFAYVDPKNRSAQLEIERVFTNYLKRIDAYLPPEELRDVPEDDIYFPLEASVVIPVKDRKETINDAVRSALAQKTDFPFNVLVIDNHSTDGTTDLLSHMARINPSLYHIIPERTDYAIGGCWNLAVDSDACGRYAVQLDSDDLYEGTNALQTIVNGFRASHAAMMIGSYTLVDFEMIEIPPGRIDHREWTSANGHNNGLRVNGFGAPRAFYTPIARRMRFPNVSYGEDYAITLRICREYRIGRIFESLYLCRRWSGNTDARLSIEEANRNDVFKDRIRSDEIAARRRLNARRGL
jgi:hypothetical protein